MRETKSKESLLEVHSNHFHNKLNLKNIKPSLYFSDTEKQVFNEKFKDLPKSFAVIQPIGKITYTPNKEWGFEKFQNIVNDTDINWIQTGLEGDITLSNVINYTNRTRNIRELAYVISKAKFVLCLEGLLNHISAAVNTKSLVIFSGFSFVELAKYDSTIVIVNTPQVECSPCWLLDKCPLSVKNCTENITVNSVLDVINKENSLS
jgi:ADP-heptose:LPS heptosyltransferase